MSQIPPLSNSGVALRLGKHHDFFTHVKRNSPKLYRLMRIYGRGCLYTGASAYFKAVECMRADLAGMYYELSLCRCVTRFFEDTKELNPYKSVQSLNSTLKTSAFTLSDRTARFHGYVSGKKLLRIYGGWRESGYTEEEKQAIKDMHD